MQGMFIPCGVTDARKIEVTELGQKKTINAVDVRLANGIDEIITTAFGDTAQKVIDLGNDVGNMWAVDVSFTTAKVKKDDGEFLAQRCRLNKFEKLW